MSCCGDDGGGRLERGMHFGHFADHDKDIPHSPLSNGTLVTVKLHLLNISLTSIHILVFIYLLNSNIWIYFILWEVEIIATIEANSRFEGSRIKKHIGRVCPDIQLQRLRWNQNDKTVKPSPTCTRSERERARERERERDTDKRHFTQPAALR